MADDPQAYTPEELAALEATAEKASSAGMIWPSFPGRTGRCDTSGYPAFTRETCLRLIHQLRQQTARAEAAERELDERDAVWSWVLGHDRPCTPEYAFESMASFNRRREADLAIAISERDAARTALAAVEKALQFIVEASSDTRNAARNALAAIRKP